MFRKLSKQISLLVLFGYGLTLSGCSSMGYVSKSNLKSLGYTKTSRGVKTKNYAGFTVNSQSFDPAENNDQRIILIGKQRSMFFAETMLHKGDSNKKDIIKKSFISIGADRRKKGGLLQFRLLY